MESISITELRRFRRLLAQIHDAVSFGARLQGNAGCEFEWKIAGFDLDPDLSYELSFTAICLDHRVNRFQLTGREDGVALTQDAVARVNSELQAFGLTVTDTAVEEVRQHNQQTCEPFIRVSLTFATADLASDRPRIDEESRS